MRGVGKLLELILGGVDLLAYDLESVVPALCAALAFFLVLALVARDPHGRRAALEIETWARLAGYSIPGAVLLYWAVKLAALNWNLEGASEHGSGRVIKLEPTGDPFVHPRDQLLKLDDGTVLRLDGGPLTERLQPGEHLELWFREEADGRARVLQADLNNSRVLEWQPPIAIPFLMALGGVGMLSLVVWGGVALNREMRQGEQNDIIEQEAKRPATLQDFLGDWTHTDDTDHKQLVIMPDGRLRGVFESATRQLRFSGHLRVRTSGRAVLDGSCDLFQEGRQYATVGIRIKLRRTQRRLRGTLECPALTASKLGFRLSRPRSKQPDPPHRDSTAAGRNTSTEP